MDVLILAPLVLGLGACASVPSPQEIHDVGFRTPEMTFKALQVGVGADLPRLEYGCLSMGFKARFNGGQGLSQLAYRELREQVLSKRLEFWLGIPDAVILETRPLSEGRSLLRASSHGHEFELELVREEFWQAWAGAELLADEPLPRGSFGQWVEIYRSDGAPAIIGAGAPLPPELSGGDLQELGQRLTEFRIGREWKIDRILGLEEATPL